MLYVMGRGRPSCKDGPEKNKVSNTFLPNDLKRLGCDLYLFYPLCVMYVLFTHLWIHVYTP